MRVGDRSVPTIGGDHPGPDSPLARWSPVDLFIGIERLPVTVYHWDDGDAVWDDPSYQWDTDNWPYDRIDATCDFQGLEISVGSPDPEGRMDAGEVNLTLANPYGIWSQYDASGKLVLYGPGSAIDIWSVVDGAPWWLFSGRITAWSEDSEQKTVEVQAFDASSDLNQPIGPWDPGVYGQTVQARMNAILDRVGSTSPRRLNLGDVTLHSFESNATPLEELQSVAISDGGIFGVDADGTIIYRDRQWPGGRLDQEEVRIFSDNVKTDGVLNVWEPGIRTDDTVIVNNVRLENVAKQVATATNPASIDRYGTQTDDRTADQWIEQFDGDELAALLAYRRAEAYFRIETFTLYLHDPRQDLWRAGIDMRVGDIVRFPHDQPAVDGPARIDINLAVQAIHHEITPAGWVVTFATTRAVGNNIVNHWDKPGVAWDSTPAAEWGP